MATEAAHAHVATPATTDSADPAAARPYPPGWMDVAISWIHARPWPWAVSYLGLTAAGVVFSNAQNWLSGGRIEFSPIQTAWGVLTVGLFVAVDLLNQVAGASFDQFEPALGSADVNRGRLRYELTTFPRTPSLVLLAISYPFTAMYYFADPVASQVTGLSPIALVMRGFFEGTFTAVLLTLIAHAVRQLRIVGHLHDVADRIDLFNPAPLYAFSRLTSLTGAALIAVIALGVVLNPASLQGNGFVYIWLPWLVGFPVVALLVFVAPLRGMHGRLARMKGDLREASEERIKAVLGELHADVDAMDLSRADGLQKSLASLLQEREIVAKLPTWPWSTATLRGFLSALLLPIVLFLIQRFLAQIT